MTTRQIDMYGPSSNNRKIIDPRNKRHYPYKDHQKGDTLHSPDMIPSAATTTTTDLSADEYRQLFSEARSTPIIYASMVSDNSSLSSSSSRSVPQTKAAAIKKKYNNDNQSLCSVHSGNQAVISDNTSTTNQVFYFNTPLPSQKHQPYQYHQGDINTPATTKTTTSSNSPLHNKKKKNFLTRKWRESNQNLPTSGASIKSAFSTSRQTMKSWRLNRINLLLKKEQHLPDVETNAFCDVCEKYSTSRIRYRNGAMVWLISFILLLCTVVLFWVPFYVKYFKDVAHYCTGCGKKIGVSYRL